MIADTCLLQIEGRGDTAGSLAFMDRCEKEVLEGAALMHGCTLEIALMGKNFGAANDPEAAVSLLPWQDAPTVSARSCLSATEMAVTTRRR